MRPQSTLLIGLLILLFSSSARSNDFNINETDAREVGVRLCRSFVDRDAASFIALVSSDWAEPAKAAWRNNLEKGDYSTMPVKSCSIKDISMVNNLARVWVLFERTDGKTGQAVTGFRMNHFLFYLQSESEKWRLKSLDSAENELVGRLIAAKDNAERVAIIKAEPELNTHRALFTAVFRLQTEGRYEMTEELFKLADWYNEEFFRGRNESSLVNTNVNVLNARASNAIAMGDTSAALNFYIEGAKIAEQFQKSSGRSIAGALLIRLNIGRMYFRQGNVLQAEKYTREVLKELESVDRMRQDVLIKSAHELLADIQMQKGELDLALENYRVVAGEYKHGIGTILMKKGDLAGAAEIFDRTIKSHERSDAAKENIPLPLAVEAAVLMTQVRLEQKRNDEALTTAQKAGEYAARSRNPEMIFAAKTAEGNALLALDRKVEAASAYQEAIRVVEDGRKRTVGPEDQRVSYLSNRIEPYHRLIDIYFDRGEVWKAFEAAERSKARVLTEVLNSEKPMLADILDGEEAKKEGDLREKVVRANRELIVLRNLPNSDRSKIAQAAAEAEKLRLEYEFFETTAANKNERFRRATGVLGEIDQTKAASIFRHSKHAAVEFAFSGPHVYAFIIRQGTQNTPKLTATKLPTSADELRRTASSFRDSVATADLNYRDSARSLYDSLLAPISRDLIGITSLTIVPDDNLWQVPFAALVNRSGKFVVEEIGISYAHSITSLIELNKVRRLPKTRDGDLFAVANPTIDADLATAVRSKYRADFGALPEAEAEIGAIRKIYGSRTKTLTRGAASESAWRANGGRYRVLHLATHGVVNPIKPLHSYLYLAPTPDGSLEDGILEAREIMREQLSADIAVLSACDTASGTPFSGEGMMGLSWAFAVAGVPRVVSSQWKVESKATADLMVDFHRSLERGKGLVPSAALRTAMLNQLRRPARKHPFYWAPFISIGG